MLGLVSKRVEVIYRELQGPVFCSTATLLSRKLIKQLSRTRMGTQSLAKGAPKFEEAGAIS
jgi:hypothetical protein